ncbi:retropepsin-like aspartic protease family protein [Roseateles sp. GG27B]
MHKELPHGLKLLTIWLVILLLVFLGFKAWERESEQSLISVNADQIVLRRAADGHFHWPGTIDGVAVDFLVDTGATATALPEALARRAGLTATGQVRSQTAGGVAVGWLAQANLSLQGGVQAQRLTVTVLPQLSAPLLGMDVLSKLHFSQQGGELLIQAGAP